jgi:hypothetical protein
MKKRENLIGFIIVNVDEGLELKTKYKISELPYFIFYRKTEMLDKLNSKIIDQIENQINI